VSVLQGQTIDICQKKTGKTGRYLKAKFCDFKLQPNVRHREVNYCCIDPPSESTDRRHPKPVRHAAVQTAQRLQDQDKPEYMGGVTTTGMG
jgi:hypothetical protein